MTIGDMPVTRGGGRVKISQFCGDIIFEWPLSGKTTIQVYLCRLHLAFPVCYIASAVKKVFHMKTIR